MKKICSLSGIVGFAGLLVAIGGPALACGTGKVLFEDKFQTLDPSWSFADPDPARTNGADGLTYKWNPDLYTTKLNQSGYYENYEVCADVSMQFPDKGNGNLGVVFWGIDADNYYVLDISPVYGTYAVYRDQKGKFLKPITWTKADAIKIGAGVVNQLSVGVNGNSAVITINGQKVAEFKGQPPEGGSLVGIDFNTDKGDTGPSTLTLANFEVRELQQ